MFAAAGGGPLGGVGFIKIAVIAFLERPPSSGALAVGVLAVGALAAGEAACGKLDGVVAIVFRQGAVARAFSSIAGEDRWSCNLRSHGAGRDGWSDQSTTAMLSCCYRLTL